MERNKSRGLLIIGAGGHGKVVADVAETMEYYETIVFADDDENIQSCMGYPVLHGQKAEDVFLRRYDVFAAVGNSAARKRLMEEAEERGCFIPTLVHRSAVVASTAQVERGTVVMAGAVVNPDAKIGKGCILNTASSVDHDCVIGDYCHVSVGAHLAGTVKVGEHTWIGAGACVNNNIEIGSHCMIGSGAAVVKNLLQAGTYVGVPARML